MYKNHKKITCKNCGRLIDIANIKKHENACINGYKNIKNDIYILDHDDLFCKFCKKECKNKNSLIQHELRCKENPNRKDYDRFSKYITENRKGKTKENCEEIAKQAITLKEKYKDGYTGPGWGYKKQDFYYVYEQANNIEIKKWLEYIKTLNIELDTYDTSIHENYLIIKGKYTKHNNKIKPVFEHNYIANLLLDDKLLPENTVHHIDKNKQNNSIDNLLIFKSGADHKRFHVSKYAFLHYDTNTHLFTCENKKKIIN